MNFKETELTLALPGDFQVIKSGIKRRFFDMVDLKLACTSADDNFHSQNDEQSANEISSTTKVPSPKAQIVGWPPVRACRTNMLRVSKYVKVAVDGAPYLRKVDLKMYDNYQKLIKALETMFACLTTCNNLTEGKLIDSSDGIEYVPAYEDKDGDWMLIGDVPWKMFVESCKRLRLMKRSETNGLVANTPNCSSSSC